jgi:CRP-like cAMP-binding protein
MESARISSASSVPGRAEVRDFNIAERIVMMCASAVFTGLTESECLEIAACARARTFARDELLFMQGQPSRSLVMLHGGSVKHTQISSSGEEVIVQMSGKGEPLEASAVCSPCSHSCSARAMEKCHASVWEYTRLQELLKKYPQIGINISRVLAARLDELQERFREVATEKVAQRLARALLRLMKQVGKPAKGGVEISLNREELAQMTGTTLFTISRLLSRWAEEGFVLPRREAVVVLDPQGLVKVSAADN